MPKIRTQEVFYTITPNQHKIDVTIMYDVNSKVFYVVPPDLFSESINTMPDELKKKYFIESSRNIRGVRGWAIIHESESELIKNLPFLFHYCGNAIKIIRNVIIVWCKGKSSIEVERFRSIETNIESKEISQSFKFILAVETKVGDGVPVYTYQNVTFTNTINLHYYDQNAIVIDDTPQNRAFLSDVYNKFDNLIINLQKFFENSETVLQLISSNQKLLG